MAVNVNAPWEVIQDLRNAGKTPDAILANIESFMERMQATTMPNLAAQKKRAEKTHHIRAGGAPGTKSEAQAQIRELIGQYSQVATGVAGWDRQTMRNEIRKLADQIKKVNAEIPGKLAILFHSGGPFLYPTSTPADYASLVAAGSKGKAVWRMGLGPDKHPTYVRISVTPERIIDSQYASSSWVIAYYLVSQP